jgi:hypothetical protein
VYSAVFSPDGTSLFTAGEGPPRLRRVTWSALWECLRENTHVCLTPDQRMKFLAESKQEAEAAFAECEARLRREG